MKGLQRKFLQERAKRNSKRDLVISCIGSGCDDEEFVEDSIWTSWSEWSKCICRSRASHRSRVCIRNGGECNGVAKESRNCDARDCPSHSNSWEAWNAWGLCNNIGEQNRSRVCDGTECAGCSEQTRPCYGAAVERQPQMTLAILAICCVALAAAMLGLIFVIGRWAKRKLTSRNNVAASRNHTAEEMRLFIPLRNDEKQVENGVAS